MLEFPGIWIPLVTPFRDGAVDLPGLDRLVRHLAGCGVAGFVVCGSTGEAAMLDDAEQDRVLAATLGAAGRLPVLMGLAGVRSAVVGARARRIAEDQPAVAGFLLAAPAYVKPPQSGIVAHFHHVAEVCQRPLVAYDIPARTGVHIEPATLRAIAEHPRIVALKDCSGSRATSEAVLADGRLVLLAGNDDELFDQLARGAAGGITASAHVVTRHYVALAGAIAGGRLDTARALWRTLSPLTRALFDEPSPGPVKALLAADGWIANELRAPMQAAGAAAVQRAAACATRCAAEPISRP